VSFWCSATGAAWTWQWRAYPGVWLFIVLLALGMWTWNRAGARAAGRAPRSAHPLFVGGLLVLWLALDWPIGALGAGRYCRIPLSGTTFRTEIEAPASAMFGFEMYSMVVGNPNCAS
jgi:hypothetical protein